MIMPQEYGDKIFTFLCEWQAWAVSGAPPHRFFMPGEGLCDNFRRFCIHDHRLRAVSEFRAMLDNRTFPFGGEGVYISERQERSAYRNIRRRAWVADAILELQKP